jgi:polysaccharide export outer membrane protein
LVAASLAGCVSSPKLGGDPNLRVTGATELPAPGRSDLTASTADYYVGPFDIISINVFGVEELGQQSVQVDASGKIRYPLVGEVAELRAAYIRDPQVIVNLVKSGSQQLTISGDVKTPGMFPIMGRMTLMRAMALAGGVGELGNAKDVVVFRTVNGQRYAALYNLKQIRLGAYPDPEIYANDVISVGEDRTRRIFKDVLSTFPVIFLINQITG